MRQKWLLWIQQSKYFILILTLGVLSWSFTFDFTRKLLDPKPLPFSSSNEQTGPRTRQLASIAKSAKDIEATEYRYLQGLTNKEIVKKLRDNRHQWLLNREDYSSSIETIKFIDQKSQKKLPKKFAGNPVFRLFEDLTTKTAAVQYEDRIACDSGRLFYDNQISQYPQIKDLLIERSPSSDAFSQQCVLYSMHAFQVPKSNFAVCPAASGPAQVPGSKPCITPPLVNMTYNAYMDITSCLGINPKHLMPKIDFESGYFLNTFGPEKEGGLGQLTRTALLDVNNQYDHYMQEIQKNMVNQKACERVMAYKDLLTQAAVGSDQRCAVMGLPENPIRNIFYTVLLNRINRDRVNEQFEKLKLKEKLERAGVKNPNIKFFQEMTAMAGYNIGVGHAVRILNSYLDSRIEQNLTVTAQDFNFYNKDQIVDLDGQKKTEVEVARAYVLSSYIDPLENDEKNEIKAKRRKDFPRVWSEALKQSFPVYLTLKANSYTGQSLNAFTIYGYPGYLSLLSERNQGIRELFTNSDLNPDSCTDGEFLNYDQPN